MVERVDRFTFTLSQKFYIDSLLDEYKLQDAVPTKIPIRKGIELRFNPETMSRKVDKDIPFRRLVMQLYWLARCYFYRILYACCFFAGFNNCYDAELFEELKKVLLYVKGHMDFKQTYCVKPGSKLEFTFVCDADYSGDRPSTFGGIG